MTDDLRKTLQAALLGSFGSALTGISSNIFRVIGSPGQPSVQGVIDASALQNAYTQQILSQQYQLAHQQSQLNLDAVNQQMAAMQSQLSQMFFPGLQQASLNPYLTSRGEHGRVEDIATAQDMAFVEDAERELEDYLNHRSSE